MGKLRYIPLLLSVLLGVAAAHAGEITSKGQQLAKFYDSLDVERHWLAGQHVNWYTGDRDSDRHGATHCSAFVASACQRLGVYILRPPQHPQELLANAQFEWLHAHGPEQGWKPVRSPLEAQRLANEGVLVVAAYQNGDSKKPGHIALVRPSLKDDGLVKTVGPQLIQAGGTNYRSANLKTGFKNHPDAWIDASHHAVRFYQHAIGDVSHLAQPKHADAISVR
jgi:hypothetical protein